MHSRLFEIISILLYKPGTTAARLARRFEVSARTIYRDLDALSAAGVPVYAKKGKGGGIFLMEGFSLDKTLLTERERGEVLMGLESMAATGHPNAALEKLRTFLQQDNSWVSVDFTGWSAEQAHTFETVREAVLRREAIEFDYYASNGEASRRAAEPLQLAFKSRNWYLLAYCRDRRDYRMFRLSRVKNIARTGEAFARELPEAPPLQSAGGAAELELRLWVSPRAAWRLYDEFDEGQIEKNADGSYTVAAVLPENEWLYGYVLSYGPDAKVLGPPRVERAVRERLARMVEGYGPE